MVAEALPETAVETKLDAAPPTDITPSPQSDAAAPNPDAAEQDVDAFFAARKEGKQGGTEADASKPDDDAASSDDLPEVREAREAAARDEREKVGKAERERIQQEAR